MAAKSRIAQEELKEVMLQELIAKSIVYIFPAYSANAVPVALGGGLPLDFGKILRDNQPVFGPHKTFKGFFAGLTVGTSIGVAEAFIFPGCNPFVGFALSLGALMGDLAGAFAKRRLGLAPGAPLPVVDQVGFVLCAFAFSLPVAPPTPLMAAIILLLTIPIHLLTNFLAYLIGVKEKPW